MSELRTLAEAEAREVYPAELREGWRAGFIAGRTSVTQLEIERAIMGRTATAGARAVMAILRGETNDD